MRYYTASMMTLNQFLSAPGAPTVTQLRTAIRAKSNDQVKQWRYGYSDRRPSPVYCVRIERVTGGEVCRWDLRPDDWWEIWPELVGVPGAPEAPPEAFERWPVLVGVGGAAQGQPTAPRL